MSACMQIRFSEILLEWYCQNGRNLPWRETRNPYVIWISEVILQQTQIKQGYDYFIRFMKRFPDVYALAGASEDEVLACWQGLGYYSRARNLHAAARQIVAMGGFPATYEGIRSLKGVGEYTAAAIASFAYGLPYAVVDGNVYRVLSRYFGIEEPIDVSSGKKYFASLAADLLPADRAADYNQALMDFGAMQCTPKSPDCVNCPLADSCVALAENKVSVLPYKSRKTSVTKRFLSYIMIRHDGAFAFFKRTGQDIWKGLYEPFLIEVPDSDKDSDSYNQVVRLLDNKGFLSSANTGFSCLATGIRHQLTHRTIICDFYLLDLSFRPNEDVFGRQPVWITPDEFEHFAMPQLVVQLIEKIHI